MVLAATETGAGLSVITAPVTTKHHEPEQLVVVPPRVARHLGLLPGCGVVCNDLDRFIWVGVDVRARPGGTPYFGQMPGRLVEEVIRRVIADAVARIDRDG